MDFYSAVIFIEVFAAVVVGVLIIKNPMLEKNIKVGFALEFATLVIVCVSEWLNIVLNGAPEYMRFVHYFVKYMEFAMVPAVPAVACMALARKAKKPMFIALVVHWIVLAMGGIFKFIYYMDETNTYQRGSLYYIFVAFYGLFAACLVAVIIKTGKKLQNNSVATVILGGVFLVSGIILQLIDSTMRVSWLCVEYAVIMSYIYINDLLLQTDRLTGLLNRWCYEKRLGMINYPSGVIIFDVDNFKSINDTFGHPVGDEALKTVARLIRTYFGKDAKCYRIGGDEFVALLRKSSKYAVSQSEERLNALLDRFLSEVQAEREKDPRFTGVSVGYSFINDDFGVEWAVDAADHKMYECKKSKKIHD